MWFARNLDFPHGAVEALCCSAFGDVNSRLMPFDGLQCNGTELDLEKCPSLDSRICEVNQGAGVICNETDYSGKTIF